MQTSKCPICANKVKQLIKACNNEKCSAKLCLECHAHSLESGACYYCRNVCDQEKDQETKAEIREHVEIEFIYDQILSEIANLRDICPVFNVLSDQNISIYYQILGLAFGYVDIDFSSIPELFLSYAQNKCDQILKCFEDDMLDLSSDLLNSFDSLVSMEIMRRFLNLYDIYDSTDLKIFLHDLNADAFSEVFGVLIDEYPQIISSRLFSKWIFS